MARDSNSGRLVNKTTLQRLEKFTSKHPEIRAKVKQLVEVYRDLDQLVVEKVSNTKITNSYFQNSIEISSEVDAHNTCWCFACGQWHITKYDSDCQNEIGLVLRTLYECSVTHTFLTNINGIEFEVCGDGEITKNLEFGNLNVGNIRWRLNLNGNAEKYQLSGKNIRLIPDIFYHSCATKANMWQRYSSAIRDNLFYNTRFYVTSLMPKHPSCALRVPAHGLTVNDLIRDTAELMSGVYAKFINRSRGVWETYDSRTEKIANQVYAWYHVASELGAKVPSMTPKLAKVLFQGKEGWK